MDEMKVKLEACFERLQRLQVQPTLANLEILTQTLYDIREVYNKLNETEGENNARIGPAADLP